MNDAGGKQESSIIDIDRYLKDGPGKRGHSATFISDSLNTIITQLENDPNGKEKLVKLARHSYFAVEAITGGLAVIGNILSQGDDSLPTYGVEALGFLIEEMAGIANNQASAVDEIILILAKKGGAQ